jgi:hypothetical protein
MASIRCDWKTQKVAERVGGIVMLLSPGTVNLKDRVDLHTVGAASRSDLGKHQPVGDARRWLLPPTASRLQACESVGGV